MDGRAYSKGQQIRDGRMSLREVGRKMRIGRERDEGDIGPLFLINPGKLRSYILKVSSVSIVSFFLTVLIVYILFRCLVLPLYDQVTFIVSGN